MASWSVERPIRPASGIISGGGSEKSEQWLVRQFGRD